MIENFIKSEASRIGFSAVGITTADPVDDIDPLREAIRSGRIAGMNWLARDPEKRCAPASLLSGARSVICLALAYGENGIGGTAHDAQKNRARFARGADYHDVIREKLSILWKEIETQAPGARARLCVDTKPILEKALSARAGLGFIGKHTILVNHDLGSWLVLGLIVTDLKLIPDAQAKVLCGDCDACIKACPSSAIISPHTLDARRCVSYLSIEEGGGDLKQYGCDICQEVCPFNCKPSENFILTDDRSHI